MMLDLRRVLSALRAANLTLKPSKCTSGAPELDYLVGWSLFFKFQNLKQRPPKSDLMHVQIMCEKFGQD